MVDLNISLLERHLATSTRQQHGRRNCPECALIIPQTTPETPECRLNSQPMVNKDPFEKAETSQRLDEIFQHVVPGVTRNAAGLLTTVDKVGILSRFLTIAGSSGIYFPSGVKDLLLLQSYATKKSVLDPSPEMQSKWFAIAMVCEDFGHRILN